MSTGNSKMGLVRSTAWNMAGQVLPALAIVGCLPVLVWQLGSERFGLLTILWSAWVALTHADLGLGRATVWAVSRAEDGRERAETVWTSLAAHVVMGVFAGCAFGICSPWLSHFLVTDQRFIREFHWACLWIGLSIPFLVIRLSLVGYLEGIHRFDLVNRFRIPTSAMTYVAPVVTGFLWQDLASIVASMSFVRVVSVLGMAATVWRTQPAYRFPTKPNMAQLRSLAGVAGGLCVSSLVTVLQPFLERSVVGSLCGAAALTAFVIPYEMVTRLWIVSTSLLAALFPQFASSSVKLSSQTCQLTRALLILLSAGAAGIVILVLVGTALIDVMLDPDLAPHGRNVTALLGIGVFFNVLVLPQMTWLQANRRVWAVSLAQVTTSAAYLLTVLVRGQSIGVTGVAALWALKVAIESIWIHGILRLVLGRFFRLSRWRILGRRLGEACGFVAVALVVSVFFQPNLLLATFLASLAGGMVAWRAVTVWLPTRDRRAIQIQALSLAGRLAARFGRTRGDGNKPLMEEVRRHAA